MLFTEEVENINELVNKITELKLDLNNNLKVAVVCFVFDTSGKLILQKRGEGARDDVGKLCAIGGSANYSDPNFRESLMREIREEGGENARVRIDSFIGAIPKKGFDKNAGVFNDWVILAYRGTLIEGEFINSEPERCAGFIIDDMEAFMQYNLGETAKICIAYMLNKN